MALLLGIARADVPTDEEIRTEARLLARLAPAATRQGLRLQIKAANGQVVRFDSDHPADETHAAEYVDHRLTGTTRDGKFFIVHSLSYEGETTFWVSHATGQQVEVFDTPAVSPDGRFAVTAMHSEAAGPEGVFVWEIVGDELVPRGHLRNGNYGLFTFLRWAGHDAAELALYSHSHLKFCPGSQASTATVRLARGPNGWALAGPASAREVRCE